ncbi:hypothetical protein [uncultured Tenacibaculum sp.]|uniref:hypothetical protein n=1 Tax=uncultured Tenacibaculum sp. TaxID=174713 RepID=UPI00261738E4|nr:hypothetical protein [uncultured Tenacibaculum sp.]
MESTELDRISGKLFVILILGFIGYHSVTKSNDLIDNGVVTEGEIIGGHYIGGKFYIKYVFFVEEKKIIGEKRVTPFKCDDGSKCCIGKKVKVFYSTKNPENSDINLGKYNKYKVGKRLYEFFHESPATIDSQE